jgi:hypothetical protein
VRRTAIVLRFTLERERILELTFLVVFSAVILVAFYALISMNGLVLGNDPAVHLEKAQIFLQTGKISLENLGWTPPLYQILLATLIAFTGASSFEQMIFLVKAAAVVVNWLLLFSVYLLGSKVFGRKVGATAAVLLLLCFPMYEVNMFGGYTTVLALAFMFLVLLYTPLATEHSGYLLVTFFAAFALVLSHQLATFLAVFIMPPILLFMLIKSKGAHLKVVIALIVGGAIAFFLYYFQAMIGYLDLVIEYVFFAIKAYAYQIPATSFNAFMINFGFIFFFALGGMILSYYLLKAKKTSIFYLILMLSFFVPLFFAESYLFGLYLPFQWFIYYLMPPLAILAAVSFVFIVDRFSAFYVKYKKRWKPSRLKAVAVSLVILILSMLVFRFGVVYGKIMEASVYYSTSDLKAYDAGVWLKNNFPDNTTVVVTEVPGFWFRIFSGKTVIAETDPIVQRNEITSSVLELSYELEQPQTLIRAYESKGDISDENYVSINQVWNRVSYAGGDGNFISYTANGVEKELVLSSLNREIVFEDQSSPKKLTIHYFNDEINITQAIVVRNDSYPIDVAWTLSPMESELSDVALYVSTFFDLHFSFEKAYVPGVLDWENPWDKPSDSKGNEWAVANFSRSTLTGNYLGFYDEKNEIVFAMNLNELPDWGNVGALGSRQIDAIRLQYDFDKISINQPASFTYQVLTFSQSSFPEMPNFNDLKSLFAFKPATTFEVSSRDYRDYITEHNIGFVVYDKNQLDTKIIRCKLLELVYSNDRYVIFRIKSNP